MNLGHYDACHRLQIKVDTAADLEGVLAAGARVRSQRAADRKAHLASSHAIFLVHISQQGPRPPPGARAEASKDGEWMYQSSLLFVDLAHTNALRTRSATLHSMHINARFVCFCFYHYRTTMARMVLSSRSQCLDISHCQVFHPKRIFNLTAHTIDIIKHCHALVRL